jgi:hypothetical protein
VELIHPDGWSPAPALSPAHLDIMNRRHIKSIERRSVPI